MEKNSEKNDLDRQVVRLDQPIRISTRSEDPHQMDDPHCAAGEQHIVVEFIGCPPNRLTAGPAEPEALAIGLACAKGLINGPNQIAWIDLVAPDHVQVKFGESAPQKDDIPAEEDSCSPLIAPSTPDRLPQVGRELTIKANMLRSIRLAIGRRLRIFRLTKASHCAGLFDRTGQAILVAEDFNRRNALTKVIGKRLLSGLNTAGLGVFLSGRVDQETIAICARAGLELVAAGSAPTGLAVETAAAVGITLAGFVREDQAVLYTHPTRIEGVVENGRIFSGKPES